MIKNQISSNNDYNLKITEKETEGKQFIFWSFLAGLFTFYAVNKIANNKNILK